ncbi:MAG: type II toxin-antitoxin system Phd/YefM family antitoxin [candidate division Zixibacteria bacterium]|nr:type II toxin-antitoxin system Phd/YefM family antitoxin [Candidatus Tariuqbacter arcticus]
MNTIPSTEVGSHIDEILQEVEQEIVRITRHNKPKAVIISYELYESLLETLEILSDSEMIESIQTAEREIAESEYVNWEDFKRNLEN